MFESDFPLAVIIPAAGVGKRMRSNCPKQYLKINGKTILEHTVERILSHPSIDLAVIALSADDEYYKTTALPQNPKVATVIGGEERVDSVLAGLKSIDTSKYSWALVHDAARPCVSIEDLSNLITECFQKDCGGILASPVRDTMKRAKRDLFIAKTECRDNLWHALTPQMYPVGQLIQSIEKAIEEGLEITDESSAIELANFPSLLVEGSNHNLKVTHPSDLMLAELILGAQPINNT